MKQVRRLFAFALTLVMAFAMCATALASTVTNKTDHKYNVYQIFSGTQTETAGDTKLGDVDWGEGINSSAFLTALKADSRFGNDNPFASCTTALDVANVMNKKADDSDFAKAFANVAAANVSATVSATVEGGAVTPDLAAGYYLFVDTSKIGKDDAANSALLQVTNSSNGLTIAKKYDVPSLDKDIIENDDEVEAADKAIGDTVTYQLIGTLPSNYDDYETYKYVFNDKISVGQAIKFNSFKITLDSATGTDITSLFKNSLTADTDGSEEKTFTLTCNNLKDNAGINITSKSKIYVRYNVTITSAAKIGSTGNKNEGWLQYSNNPNSVGEGTPTTSETPHDENLVFTYELNPTKVDGSDKATKLPDAQFSLQATNGEHSGKYVQIDAYTKKVTGWLDAAPTALETVPTTGNTGVLVSGANGTFEVYGLDAGTYKLTEIKAPSGYNTVDPISITITATVVGDDTTEPALTSLKITVGKTEDTGDYAGTGILPMTVENYGGAVLPSTGGIGTTIFYIVGGVMVAGAAIFLLTKRRVSAE